MVLAPATAAVRLGFFKLEGVGIGGGQGSLETIDEGEAGSESLRCIKAVLYVKQRSICWLACVGLQRNGRIACDPTCATALK
jgi:hypothetical protein